VTTSTQLDKVIYIPPVFAETFAMSVGFCRKAHDARFGVIDNPRAIVNDGVSARADSQFSICGTDVFPCTSRLPS
jgi:hypothetical protein